MYDVRKYNWHKREHMQTYADSNFNGFLIFITFILIQTFIGILIYFFKDNLEILIPILTGLIGLAAGAFGGYGVGKQTKKE